MKEYFKIKISDFQEKKLEAIYSREIEIPLDSSKIITISGARRVGKTYLLYSLIKKLREKYNSELLIYINFEDERLFPFQTSYLNDFLEAYYELYPANRQKQVFFFFDEIQNIPNWELFIRRLYDNENCRIFITGSSSKMLSSDIATSLRGRTLNYELFPLSFSEYVKLQNLELNLYSTKARSFILNAFDFYTKNTSFPEIINFQREEAQKALHEFYDLLIYRDLIDRYNIRNIALIKYLTKFLFVNTANFVSYNKIYNDIKSQGFNISKSTIFDYIDFLQSSYAVYTTSLFTENTREQNRNPRKIYTLDTGLKNILSISSNYGRTLENIVFLHLRRKFNRIFYYKGKQEIDFCIIDNDEKINLINVSFEITTKSTYEREINSLIEGMKFFGLNTAIIITQNTEKEIIQDNLHINILPMWKWLLFNPNNC